jgi:hypothetical protein
MSRPTPFPVLSRPGVKHLIKADWASCTSVFNFYVLLSRSFCSFQIQLVDGGTIPTDIQNRAFDQRHDVLDFFKANGYPVIFNDPD